jgi:hypothetical protein
MSNAAGWMIAVVYSEWLQWVATGRLRCHIERIQRINGPADFGGVHKLLDKAPYIRREDAAGVLVALLNEHWRTSASALEGADSPSLLWLDLSGVTQFFPLSERAGRLLQADVERTSCPLGPPMLEPLWQQWMDEQDVLTAQRSATSFTRAFGLIPSAELAAIQRLRADLELIRSDPKKAEGRKRYEATWAFPWAEALALFRHTLSDTDFQKLDQAQLRKVAQDRAADSKLSGGVLRLESNRQQADELGAHLPATPLQFRQWLVVSHYQHLIKLERALDAVEIAQDLSWLIDEHGDTALATQAAYLIGLDAPEELSTVLYCAAHPSEFPCLKPRGLPGVIDVAELARPRRPVPVPPPVPEATSSETTTPETTTSEPTTSDPTAPEPTIAEPTTPETTTPEPTTAEPTTQEPTTQEPTTQEPTTPEPTTPEPTTPEPTTPEPTTPEPTTPEPTTPEPTTPEPTTPGPTAPETTAAEPASSDSTSSAPSAPGQSPRGKTKNPKPAQSALPFADESATPDSPANEATEAPEAAGPTTPAAEPPALDTAPADATPATDSAPEPAPTTTGNPT